MQFLKKTIQFFLFVCLVIISIMVFMQTIFRNLDISISGFDEIIGISAMWAYFFGMAHSTLSDTHIKGGVEEMITNKTFSSWLSKLGLFLLFVFSVVCLVISAQVFITAYLHKYVTIYFGIPLTFSIAALLVGFALNILILILRAVRTNRKITG